MKDAMQHSNTTTSNNASSTAFTPSIKPKSQSQSNNLSIHVIRSVVSMDDEGVTPRNANAQHDADTPLIENTTVGTAAAAINDTVVVRDNNTTTTTTVVVVVDDDDEQEEKDITLLGQDYLDDSTINNDDSLPPEGYDASVMNDILKDLGASFLNATIITEDAADCCASPLKNAINDETNDETNNDNDDDDDDNHCQQQHHDDDDNNSPYPFPSGDDHIQNMMDSSLLQASLSSSPLKQKDYSPSGDSRNYYYSQQLHDRNSSLIKEIRFAEQSCVELGQDKKFLEQELKNVQSLLEDEFSTKHNLLEKMEQLAESHQHDLEYERNLLLDDVNLELENERRQHKIEWIEQFEKERQSKVEVEEQLEQERQHKVELKEQLEQERQTKVELKEQLEQERQSKVELYEQFEKERQNKVELEEQLEQERQTKVELNEQFEYERDIQDEVKLELENERQTKIELKEQLEQERQSKIELEEQLEEERQSKIELEEQLEKELQTKAGLTNALALQRVDDEQKQDNPAITHNPDMRLSMRIADLETRLAQAQDVTTPDEKLSMRVEELEAQNAHLKRQLLPLNEPDGMSPRRRDKKPDAPNVARKLQLDNKDATRECVVDLETKLRAVEVEYSMYKEAEKERFGTLQKDFQQNSLEKERLDTLQKNFQQKAADLATKLTDMQKEKERMEEELSHQRNVTAGLTTWKNDSVKEVYQDNQRLEDELLKQRRGAMDLERKLAALQKDYNQAGLLEQSLRMSIGDVKERLAHVEQELTLAHQNCHSLGQQLNDQGKSFRLQRQAERQVAADEFAQVIRVATHRLTQQADVVETTLLHKIEEYRIRVVKLTFMVETLRSTLDFEFSEANSVESVLTMESVLEPQDVPGLDATFRRTGADESLLYEMEGARLPSKEDHSVNGWLKMMDISKIDDSAVMEVKQLQSSLSAAHDQLESHVTTIRILEEEIENLERNNDSAKIRDLQNTVSINEAKTIEVKKLQSSLSAAHDQLESHVATIGILEEEIENLDRERNNDSAKIHDLQNTVSTNEAKIAAFQVKLKSAERSSTAVEELQQALEGAESEMYDLQNTVSSYEAKISKLQVQLKSTEASSTQVEELQHVLEGAEAEIDRLRVAYVTCNDRLAAAFETITTNEDLVGQFKESSDEAVKVSAEAAGNARADNNELVSRLAVLETELERTKKNLRKRESEKIQMDELKTEIHLTLEDTTNSLLEVTQQRDAARKGLRELEIKFSHTTDERDAIENALEDAINLRTELEAKIRNSAHFEGAKNDLAEKLEETVGSLITTTKERDALKIDYKVAIQKLAAADSQIGVISEELSTIQAARDSALRRHADIAAQLRTVISVNSDKVQELEEELAMSTAEVDRLRQTFVGLNDRLAALSEEKAQNTNTIAELQQSLAHAEADLAEVQQQHGFKVNELENAWRDLSRATDASLDHKEEIIKLRSHLEQSQTEQEVLRQSAAKAEQSVDRSTLEFTAYKRCMEERITERQEVLCEVQSFSESKQRELREKLVSIEKSKDELIFDISNELDNFCNDFVESAEEASLSFVGQATWKESLHCAKLLVSTLLENERDGASRLEIQLSDANVELQQAASEVADTSKELLETRDALETLQRSFTDKTKLAACLCRERDDAHSRLVFLTGKLEESSRGQDAAKADLDEMDALLTEHRGGANRLQSKNDQLDSKNLKLREYIRKLTSKCEEWQESWEQQNRIIFELRS